MKLSLKKYYLNTYNATIFKLVVPLKRLLAKKLSFGRPGSFPYITGDGFRSLAQHIMDDISSISTNSVSDGDIIFIRTDMLNKFFEKVCPEITARFILISQNADNNMQDEFSRHIDEKIIHWFSQNLLFDHPKATPLPIGLINFRYSADTALIKKYKFYSNEKKDKIAMSFSSHLDRHSVKSKLDSYGTTETLPHLNKADYYDKMSGYKFVASPEGNGIDCHRTWEAMYLGCIPVVLRNSTTSFFEKIGLPILVIDRWEEVSNFNKDFLNRKYAELEKNFVSPALNMSYWINLILNKTPLL
jgi:hypothetical protein